MADINIDGIVTWLKNWFYDKSEVNTIANSKVNLNQGQANKNVVTNASGEITVEDKPTIPTDVSELTDNSNTPFTPKSHTHGQVTNDGKITSTAVTVASGDNILITDASDSSKIKRVSSLLASHIKDSTAHSNIGSSANDTQETINTKIDSILGSFVNVKFIEITTDKGTASLDKMNKLWVETKNSKTDVYFVKQSGTSPNFTYSWESLDTDILDNLVINWSDVQNKPSTFTPSSHTHGNIQNDGTMPSNAVVSLSSVMRPVIWSNTDNLIRIGSFHNAYVCDKNAHTNIGSSANDTQETINTNIDTALGSKGAVVDDVDWSYNSNGFTNGVKLVSKTDNANGRITLHLKS